jgi:tetratricopeptide (TPR) repeat protein/O-antigen ligase
MPTKLSFFCEKVIESGWLVAVIVIPLFFNPYSQRVFESDKTAILRSIALFIVVVWMIKLFDSSGGFALALNQEERLRDNGCNPFSVLNVFRVPFVFPVLLAGSSYVISTIFSVVPGTSIWGSYSRLQGTYTFFCYLSFFILPLSTMRDEGQLRRLWIAIILTSLPVSLYGLLQHLNMDPMPWGGNKASAIALRVVSTMGNPNFLGAYMILLVPVTLASLAEHLSLCVYQQRTGIYAAITACLLVCILAVQLLCLLFTQSRGPWLGLMSGIFIFILVALIGLRDGDGNFGRLNVPDLFKALIFAVISMPFGLAPAYLFFVILRKGFRWLWLSWLIHSAIIGGILISMLLPGTLLKSLKETPYIGRLSRLSPEESGSVGVRMLIWKGALDLIKSNPVRSIVGYGPEAMQTVYPPYYSPKLAYSSSGRAPVDRSHNETFDVVVTRGLIGLAGYLLLIGSIFFFGMKWLGFISTKRDRTALIILMSLGGLSGLSLPRLIEGTYRLSAAGLVLGILCGGTLFLILQQIRQGPQGVHGFAARRKYLVLGLFSALISHIVEIQFGIAVSSTQFYFWMYLALFVIAGLNWIKEGPEANEATGVESEFGTPRLRARHALMPAALATAVVLSTLGFSLINDSRFEKDWLGIIRTSLATLGPPGDFKSSTGVLWVLLTTWMTGAAISFFSAASRSNLKVTHAGYLLDSVGCAGLTLAVFLVSIAGYALLIASATDPSSIVIFVYCWLFIIIFITAASLHKISQAPARVFGKKRAVWGYAFLAILSILVIWASNITVSEADINYKMGLSMEQKGFSRESIHFYSKAISLAPDQDRYHSELARHLLTAAQTAGDSKLKEQLCSESFEYALQASRINPLDSDNYMLLGLLFHLWGEADREDRDEKLEKAHKYFRKAMDLAPNNVMIYGLWARVFLAQGDFSGALKKLESALSIDPRFGYAYDALGEVYRAQGEIREAEKGLAGSPEGERNKKEKTTQELKGPTQ